MRHARDAHRRQGPVASASSSKRGWLPAIRTTGRRTPSGKVRPLFPIPLRRLAQLEQQKLRDEMAELAKTIEELEGILSSDAKLRGVIKTELSEIADEFAEERRTQVTLETGDLDTLDLIDDEE